MLYGTIHTTIIIIHSITVISIMFVIIVSIGGIVIIVTIVIMIGRAGRPRPGSPT